MAVDFELSVASDFQLDRNGFWNFSKYAEISFRIALNTMW